MSVTTIERCRRYHQLSIAAETISKLHQLYRSNDHRRNYLGPACPAFHFASGGIRPTEVESESSAHLPEATAAEIRTANYQRLVAPSEPGIFPAGYGRIKRLAELRMACDGVAEVVVFDFNAELLSKSIFAVHQRRLPK